jgi:hypothetical protein
MMSERVLIVSGWKWLVTISARMRETMTQRAISAIFDNLAPP